MNRLVERLKGQESHCDLNPGIRRPPSHMLSEQFSEHLNSPRPKSLALGLQPLFERRVVETKTFKEITLIESHRLVESIDGVPGGELPEARHVNDDPGWIESDPITIAANRVDPGLGERMTEI